MEDDGRQLMRAVRSVRDYLRDVSLLLQTADDLMGREKWLATNNIAASGGSASVLRPELWLPYSAFRFYQNLSHPAILLFVSVLLDDPGNWKALHEAGEPLLTGGWFDYGEAAVGSAWSYDYAGYHGYRMEKCPERDLQPLDPSELWPEKSFPFARMATFGIPLVTVKSTAELKTEFVDPLLTAVRAC